MTAPDPRKIRQQQRAAEALASFMITVDGRSWPLAFPLTSSEERLLKATTGLTLADLFTGKGNVIVVEKITIGAMIWLARRQAGEMALRIEQVDALIDAMSADEFASRISIEPIGDDDPAALDPE